MFSDTRKIIGSAAATLGVALLAAAPASGTFPGENGRIAFMRKDDAGLWQVWVARADLRRQAKLTAEDANSGWPAWAPDGRRIAFDSDRADPDLSDDTAINDIFAVRPDGAGLVKLTRSDGFSGDAAYSPDGSRLAFDSDQGDDPGRQSIYTMSAADGSRVRRVTKLPDWAALELTPRFSPDCRRILFTRYLRVDRGEGVPPEEPSALYVVDVDGSHLRRITDFDLKAGDADWSPDGRWIVFETIADRVENDPATSTSSGRTDPGSRTSRTTRAPPGRARASATPNRRTQCGPRTAARSCSPTMSSPPSPTCRVSRR